MALDYDRIMGLRIDGLAEEITSRDTILYALGVGLGFEPTDERQLRYVYETDLTSLPTFATMLCRPPLWFKDPQYGVTWVSFLHAEQSLTMHRPLPPQGRFAGSMRVTQIVDRGKDKGAYIYQERSLVDRNTNQRIATLTAMGIARKDGGFGGPAAPAAAAAPRVPAGNPDHVCVLPTLPQSALIYRLSGDPNPIHADPAVAKRAGFDRPILHGLCTFGIACHAILRTLCNYESTRLKSLSSRFSAPVFPGETIRTDLWQDGSEILFTCTAVERGVVVLNHGTAVVE